MTDLVSLFKKVKPCVVALAPEPHWPKGQNAPPPLDVTGTDFCVDPLGIIVTAKHVVEPMVSEGYMMAAFASFEKTITHGRFPLFFYYAVDDLDVAVCRVWNPPMPLPALPIRTGENIEEGTWVAACGYPLGLAYAPGGTRWLGVNNMSSIFQTGIVASVVPSPIHLLKDKDWFRIDMALNPGNSGGPILLADGTVIAVVVERPPAMEDVVDEHGQASLARRPLPFDHPHGLWQDRGTIAGGVIRAVPSG